MVLGLRSGLAPAVVVPDEGALTIWGHDPLSLGLRPINEAGRADELLLADPLPSELRAAVEGLRRELPAGVAERSLPVPLAGSGHGGHADHDGHGGHKEHSGHEAHGRHEGQSDHDHGDHDHDDMMAIVGEPSADGLVMEPIAFEHGPLGAGLPGGLVLNVELDGDVVSRCQAEARLVVEPVAGPQRPLDPLAPAAWSAVITELTELAGGISVPQSTHCERLAAVELERALSHAAWLRALARLLGWGRLVDQSQAAVSALLAARMGGDPLAPPRRDGVVSAAPAVGKLAETVQASASLRMRLGGRGALTAADAPGLQGPNARAGGEARDTRSSHPLYVALGFEPVVEGEGDALARTRVRALEARRALDLALLMLDGPSDVGRSLAAADHRVALEGPRGPIVGEHRNGLQLAAPGVQAALGAAGQAAIGLEWSSALATVASFDLSPWRVPG